MSASGRPWVRAAVLAAGTAFTAWFYVRYVPLLPGYQAVVIPLFILCLAAAARRFETGLLVLTAVFPLCNSLPYFFGIDERIPHAPVSAVLFLAYVLGRWIGGTGNGGPRPRPRLGTSLAWLSVWTGLSGVLTFLRYGDFFPFAVARLHDTAVNAAGVSAGGARMSAVFSALGFGSGIVMFIEFRRAAADRAFLTRLLRVLSLSFLAALLMGLLQTAAPGMPGNTSYWRVLDQVNATFKDPNVLAACVAGFLPLLGGLFLEAPGRRRWLPAGAGILGLVILPLSGSRSGPAALAAAALLFLAGALRRVGASARRKIVAGAAGAVLVFAAWNVLVVPRSALTQRLAWSLERLRTLGAESDFLNCRLTLWSVGLRMIAETPWTGLGVGAFVVEFPNYPKPPRYSGSYSDTALNLPIQIAAEEGLLGLVLALLFALGLARRMGRIVRARGDPGGRDWLRLGAAAGLAAFFFNFLFHTYAACFEAQFFFWLLAAAVLGPDAREKPEPVGPRPGAGRLAGAVIIAAALLFLGLSLGRLSIGARADRFGWTRTFGFHDPETDPQAGSFRWTGRLAGFTVSGERPFAVLHLRALNPDLAARPLRVRISYADRRFRRLGPAGEILLRSPVWTRLRIPRSRSGPGQDYFLIEPERTWRPGASPGSSDPRELGVSVREPVGGGPRSVVPRS